MANIIPILLSVIIGITFSSAYKILVVFPFPSTSHGILGDGFVKNLLGAGHEVTYITPFVKDKPHPNLQQIDVSSLKKGTLNMDILNLSALMSNKKDANVHDHMFLFRMMLNITEKVMNHHSVQRLARDANQRFDLVIAEWMFTEMYCSFGVIFDSPCILFFPSEFHQNALTIIDELPNPAYTPIMMMGSGPYVTLLDRVKSLFFHLMGHFTKIFTFMPMESEVYENAIGEIVAKKGRSLPTYDEMIHNTSLEFYNSHVSLGSPVRSPPNYVAIGGYHIDPEVKLLPLDLKKIMDNSKNGVIYFSMGSNLKSTELPDEIKQSLLKMFGGLKQTVLWKFEDQLPNTPKNVHILNWAPQPSILSHPNCVLFITHGGLLSTTEAIHFGVPTIGIPVFADQFTNVDKAVHRGIAKRVDLTYNVAEDLELAVKEVLSNPTYTQRVKELSVIYHHRPVTPAKEMVHWVEHVIKTRGAPPLRSPALHVPWYQKMYLDLVALIIAFVALVFTILKRLCAKSRDESTKNKKNRSKKNN